MRRGGEDGLGVRPAPFVGRDVQGGPVEASGAASVGPETAASVAASIAEAYQTDAELKAATDPAVRADETEEQAADRVASAEAELDLRLKIRQFEQLGDTPPTIDIAANDAQYGSHGAHTVERHGPQITMERSPRERTVEGRIYGDPPWARPENWSYRWRDVPTMNRLINQAIRDDWDVIRNELVFNGYAERKIYIGSVVGDGFFNEGMYGAGSRQAKYSVAAGMVFRLRLVPGSDPAEFFLLTSYPTPVVE